MAVDDIAGRGDEVWEQSITELEKLPLVDTVNWEREWEYRGNSAPSGPYWRLGLNSLNMSVRLQFAKPNLHVNLSTRCYDMVRVRCGSEVIR